MIYFFLRDNDIVHCDLSLDNMLFHMDEDHMYIGTCDWGFAFRIDSPHTYKIKLCNSVKN
jgi:serine/threonine-protein kinase RIO1